MDSVQLRLLFTDQIHVIFTIRSIFTLATHETPTQLDYLMFAQSRLWSRSIHPTDAHTKKKTDDANCLRLRDYHVHKIDSSEDSIVQYAAFLC